MDIAVLGTGAVGQALASAWAGAGHGVGMGSRTPDSASAARWASQHDGSHGTFADVAGRAELVVNATAGTVSSAVLASCADGLRGKVLVDVANPLDFSGGFPPRLSICNDDSLAEQIQRDHPDARVVKALNTMANEVMVAPAEVPGDHLCPIAGAEDAKPVVRRLLGDLGWRDAQVLDLGGLDAARGMEMWLALWVRLFATFGHPQFNLALPSAPHMKG